MLLEDMTKIEQKKKWYVKFIFCFSFFFFGGGGLLGHI